MSGLGITAELFGDGDWIESKDQDPEGTVRLIQLADIGDGIFLNKSNRFMNIQTAKRLNCTFLNKGDILIARMPDPLGRCCIFPFDEKEKYVTVVDVAILRVKKDYSIKYIKYALNHPHTRHDIDGQVTGTTRKRITRKKLANLKIPLPPLAEQQKIAEILDAADALRQKDQQLIDHYTTLSQSLFLDMFGDPVTNPMGWDTSLLESVCKNIYGGGTPSKSKPEYFLGSIPWVTPKDMKKAYIDNSIDHINDEAVNNSTTKLIPIDSVLMVIRSGILKHTLPLAVTTGVVTINQDMKAFIPCETKTNSQFLMHYFMGVEKFLLGKVRAVTADNIEFRQIKKLPFPLPPITLQNQFTQHIEKIEKQKQQAQASLAQSNNLFNSLLQKAFTGELTA